MPTTPLENALAHAAPPSIAITPLKHVLKHVLLLLIYTQTQTLWTAQLFAPITSSDTYRQEHVLPCVLLPHPCSGIFNNTNASPPALMKHSPTSITLFVAVFLHALKDNILQLILSISTQIIPLQLVCNSAQLAKIYTISNTPPTPPSEHASQLVLSSIQYTISHRTPLKHV